MRVMQTHGPQQQYFESKNYLMVKYVCVTPDKIKVTDGGFYDDR